MKEERETPGVTDKVKVDGVDKTFANPVGYSNYNGLSRNQKWYNPPNQIYISECTKPPPTIPFPFEQPTIFQKECLEQLWEALTSSDKRSIAIDAPCRSGKTTAMIYLACNLLHQGICDYVFYTVPSYQHVGSITKTIDLVKPKGLLTVTLKGKNKVCIHHSDCKNCKLMSPFRRRKRFLERVTKLIPPPEGENRHISPEDLLARNICPYYGAIELIRNLPPRRGFILTTPHMLLELVRRYDTEPIIPSRSILIGDEGERTAKLFMPDAFLICKIKFDFHARWVHPERHQNAFRVREIIKEIIKIYPDLEPLSDICDAIISYIDFSESAIEVLRRLLEKKKVSKTLQMKPGLTKEELTEEIPYPNIDEILEEFKRRHIVSECNGRYYLLAPYSFNPEEALQNELYNYLISEKVEELEAFIKKKLNPLLLINYLEDIENFIANSPYPDEDRRLAFDFIYTLCFFNKIRVNPTRVPGETEIYLTSKPAVYLRLFNHFDKVVLMSGSFTKRTLDTWNLVEGREICLVTGTAIYSNLTYIPTDNMDDKLRIIKTLKEKGYRALIVHKSKEDLERVRKITGGVALDTAKDIDRSKDEQILHIVSCSKISENITIPNVDVAVILSWKSKKVNLYGKEQDYLEACALDAYQSVSRIYTPNQRVYVFGPSEVYQIVKDRWAGSTLEEECLELLRKLPAKNKAPATEETVIVTKKQSFLGEMEKRLRLTKEASAVIDYLLKREEVTRTELYLRVRKKGVDAETIGEILDELKSKGLVEIRKERTGKKGRPKETIRVLFSSKEELLDRLL